MSDAKIDLQFHAGTLVAQGPGVSDWIRQSDPVPWVFDDRANAWRTDAFHYRRLQETLPSVPSDGESGAAEAPAGWVERLPLVARLPELRTEQSDAVARWLAADGRGSIVMPTGTGKTIVAMQALSQLQTSALIVAPVRDLMYQWHRRILETFGVDAGIIGDSVYRVAPLSVTTYDSACIHMPRLGNRFELLVFDECHHLPGPIRRDAARMSTAPYRLGLTATYERSDGAHQLLDELIGPVVYRLSVTEVKGKSLADYEVIRIPVHLAAEERQRYDQLSQVIRAFMHEQRKNDPAFRWEKVCAAAQEDPLARQAYRAFMEKRSIEERAAEKLRVLEDLFRLHAGEPMLVFVGSNAMARDVSLRFLIPCLLSHCGKRERLDILQGLEWGVYPAIVANRVLDEGVDLPAVKVAVVIGGMSSTRQAKQRLGRILRRQGNQRAVLYEVVTATHGETQRSRQRRRNDAYQGTRHHPL